MFLASFAFLTAAIFSGCASDSSASTTTLHATKHPETIGVKVTGGTEAATNSASQVSRTGFAADVAKSLQRAALFEKVLSSSDAGADYHLEIALANLDTPEMGSSMTATVESTWTLTRTSNGYRIWQKTISSSHTTDSREAFTGVERVQLAIEGAVHANVQEGVAQLSNAIP